MDDKPLPALWGRIRAEELALLTGAHLPTARRWKRAVRLPRWLSVLVRSVAEGWLDDLSPEFAGWCVRGGQLISPEGWQFSPGEIRALPFLRQQLALARVDQRGDELFQRRHAKLQRSDAMALTG